MSAIITRRLRAVALGLSVCAALGLGACSKDSDLADASAYGANGAGGASTPGSAQDFVVNVGDRVFFESDSTDLTPTATATLGSGQVSAPGNTLATAGSEPSDNGIHSQPAR